MVPGGLQQVSDAGAGTERCLRAAAATAAAVAEDALIARLAAVAEARAGDTARLRESPVGDMGSAAEPVAGSLPSEPTQRPLCGSQCIGRPCSSCGDCARQSGGPASSNEK